MEEIEKLLEELVDNGSPQTRDQYSAMHEIKERLVDNYQSLQQERDSYKKKLEEVKQILDGNEGKYAQEAVRVCNEALKGK